MVYEDYKVYGPYTRKDGRQIVVAVSPAHRTTISYPKFLVEKSLGRYLKASETVDHIDCDFRNNDLSNLRVLSRAQHAREDCLRLVAVDFVCPTCNVTFSLVGKKLRESHDSRRRGKTGPFCSRQCAGVYGASVQNGHCFVLPIVHVPRKYTTLKLIKTEQSRRKSRSELTLKRGSLSSNVGGNPVLDPKDRV